MQLQYEAFIKCPKTGELVSTGYALQKESFDKDEKPSGGFNCPSCKEIHHWSYENAQILESHK